MKKITIAIDGYSSCGKSTLAKDLAKELNLVYVDSGAMYRAVALYALNHQLIKEGVVSVDKLLGQLDDIHIEFTSDHEGIKTQLNGEVVEVEIRKPNVAAVVSKVSAIPEVRKKLVALQQQMGKAGGVVMDGRDIGTVVFPNAELKLFITADPKIRAQRRFDELLEKGVNTTFDEVLDNLTQRDLEDTTRKTDPLKKAADAIEVDNSHLTKQEQLEKCLSLAKKQLS